MLSDSKGRGSCGRGPSTDAGLGGRDVSRDNYDRLAGGGVVWVYVVSTLLTHNQHVQTNVKRVNVDKVNSQKAVSSLLRR